MKRDEWLLWSTWLVGPGTYLPAFVHCLAWPGMCNDPPDMMLACCLVATQLIAGFMTLALIAVRRPRRWRSEPWLLMLYWVGIAAWALLPMMLIVVGPDRVELRQVLAPVAWTGTRVAALAAVLVPFAALLGQSYRFPHRRTR